MASGAVGVMEATRLATGTQDDLRFEIHGSRGALAFNLMDPNWLSVYDNTRPEAPLGGTRGFQKIECVARYPKPYAFGATKNPIGWPQFHVHCLFDFIDSIARGRTRQPELSRTAWQRSGLSMPAACRRRQEGKWLLQIPHQVHRHHLAGRVGDDHKASGRVGFGKPGFVPAEDEVAIDALGERVVQVAVPRRPSAHSPWLAA